MKKMIITGIWTSLAILFIIYGIVVWRIHSGTKFFLVWFALGICCTICAGLVYSGLFGKIWQNLPHPLRVGGTILVIAILAFFLVVEGLIVSGFYISGQDGLDYIIVLGAQVRKNGPSRTLKNRLNRAAAYLEENPETICIVSGGQGGNEPCTEAEGMEQYLVSIGIDPGRIIKEDESLNTIQNIRNSMAYLDAENDKVGIVTSDFHVFRGTHIAKKQGIRHVSGFPAPTPRLYKANNMFREFFGVVKDGLCGNL